MTKVTMTLLIISLTSFLIGFTDVLWGLGKPVGAICFGLFMIFKVMEKETARFDDEEDARLARAERMMASDSSRPSSQANNHEAREKSSLTVAPSS